MPILKPHLTKQIAFKALQGFFTQKPFVLFGTGTSCAVDIRFGMPALQKHLESTVPTFCSTSTHNREWAEVIKSLSGGSDFETAMNSVKDTQLLQKIICSTATFVGAIDKLHSQELLFGSIKWPAIKLIRKLVEGLPETDRTLHLATPNYDLLAEYAFSHQSIPYITGFWCGINRKLNWLQAEREVTYAERVCSGRKQCTVTKFKKHIRLYKVHGSLNTFSINGQIVENNSWIHDPPSNVERIMITPGTSKYEQLHHNRYELLGEFDKAVQEHSAFLFLGYSFNDNQINNNAILRKLKEQGSQGLIITRDCNARIDKLLSDCTNLWAVCKQNVAGNDDARIYNSAYADWFSIDGSSLWCPDKFSTEILGG
jgi:hypothetical protein